MNPKERKMLERLCQDEPEEVLKILFQQEFWPPSLDTVQTYQRFEDDSCRGTVSVTFSQDGDAWIMVLTAKPDENDFHLGFRFRMPLVGGGESDKVRKALLFLALAIKWDNEALPQNRG